ncbi:hypothetical protein E2R23_27650 [Burkholderia pseudomallei]|nr:hypothetical protein EXY28_27645 [Burkholderia pseudomallei]QBI50079.1 hypothetical protein EXY72_27695 [Burkholderia pseudomallei]QBL81327.1 hypothetical protein EYA82_27460 [Burkholderia pseudomallei]QBL87941.1 hypothetical protein EYA88_27215 [Burkholderia pseudomallei]QBP51812.1 hypothetical protein E2R28_27405 [Burkholderia pseudomallei]
MARRRSGHASASGRCGARSRGASPAPSHIRRIRPTFGPHSERTQPEYIRRTLVPRRDGRAFRESPDFRSPGAMQ